MDPREAHGQKRQVQLLDVREPHEWDAGHIPGAHHIPMGELSGRQDEIATDRKVVCVCRSGARSGRVAAALRRAGYDAENLDGGMEAWDRADLPIEDEDGAGGQVV